MRTCTALASPLQAELPEAHHNPQRAWRAGKVPPLRFPGPPPPDSDPYFLPVGLPVIWNCALVYQRVVRLWDTLLGPRHGNRRVDRIGGRAPEQVQAMCARLGLVKISRMVFRVHRTKCPGCRFLAHRLMLHPETG